jgi:hypothetical protein
MLTTSDVVAPRGAAPPQPEIPLGLCQCGCGQTTSAATQTKRRYGHVKGQPVRYINGHSHRHTPHVCAYESLRESIDYAVLDCGYVTPCWVWMHGRSKSGYGQVHIDGRNWRVHRYLYETVVGLLPRDKVIDHLCRTPACLRFDHLDPVSHAENVRRGASARLTAGAVAAIKARLATGSRGIQTSLARDYGVGRGEISAIKAGHRWADVVAAS